MCSRSSKSSELVTTQLILLKLTTIYHGQLCSTWVMMNQDTRRLSKMPQEVLAEISPYFLDKKCIELGGCQKIKKLNDNAPYIRSDLVVSTHMPRIAFIHFFQIMYPFLS